MLVRVTLFVMSEVKNMDISEVNKIAESFERTEKALEDEHLSYVEKQKKYTEDYRKFVKAVHREGYVWSLSGWVKK